jgi:excisionase family DNA binding protein
MTQDQCLIYNFSGTELNNRFDKLEARLDHFISLLKNIGSEEPECLLTKKQSAKYLQVSHVTLNKLIKEGFLPCQRLGDTLRIKKSDINKALIQVRVRKYSNSILLDST